MRKSRGTICRVCFRVSREDNMPYDGPSLVCFNVHNNPLPSNEPMYDIDELFEAYDEKQKMKEAT